MDVSTHPVHQLTPALPLSPHHTTHTLQQQVVSKKADSSRNKSKKAPLAGFEIGFTPSNEVFLGRLSMLGFGSAVVGEFLTGGQGPLAQLGYELDLQQEQVGLFLAGLIGFNLVASLLPSSATFKQQQQEQQAKDVEEVPVQQRAEGPLQDPTITLLQPAKFFNVTNWGFTPENELFAGRLGALGMVAAMVGELATGLGPVGQLSAGEARIRERRGHKHGLLCAGC
jgi:hypothetical protein